MLLPLQVHPHRRLGTEGDGRLGQLAEVIVRPVPRKGGGRALLRHVGLLHPLPEPAPRNRPPRTLPTAPAHPNRHPDGRRDGHRVSMATRSDQPDVAELRQHATASGRPKGRVPHFSTCARLCPACAVPPAHSPLAFNRQGQ